MQHVSVAQGGRGGQVAVQLYERYRPQTWQDVIGQDAVVGRIRALSKRGLAGRAYFITGKSGTGKTTIARLLAAEIADPLNVLELDAGEVTTSMLKDIERNMRLAGMGAKHGRAYIINEAHGLRRDTIRRLLVVLERIPHHVGFVFTTTSSGQESLFEAQEDASPLLSRCISVQLARRGLSTPFAERCKAIAEAEGLNGKPLSAYEQLARDCRNNLRTMIQAVDAGAMLD